MFIHSPPHFVPPAGRAVRATTSKVPHITLAVCDGGKPGASNHIEDWQPVPVQRLLGVVRQYKAYSLWRELTGLPPWHPGGGGGAAEGDAEPTRVQHRGG